MSRNDLPAKFRRHPPTHGASPDNVRTLMRRPQPASGLDGTPRIPGPTNRQTAGEHSEQPDIGRIQRVDDHLLHPFMKQLQRETRRADRTKTPLSIALFRIDGAGKPDHGKIRRFYEMIYRISRETDIPARFGVDLIAILLLDTNEDGAKTFTQRILGHAKELAVSTIAQTYPGHLFDNLLSGNDDPKGRDSSVVEDSTVPGHPVFVPATPLVAKEKWSEMLGIVKRPWFG